MPGTKQNQQLPSLLLLTLTTLLSVTGCKSGSNASDVAARNDTGAFRLAGVGCMGRIVPENGTFFVSPYVIGSSVPVVKQVDIKAGDEIVEGQKIAVLSSKPFLDRAVRSAQIQVRLAEARFTKMQAAGSSEEVAAAKAEVTRLQLQRDAAIKDYERNKPLYDQDFLSKAQIESLEFRLGESEALLTQAREKSHAVANARAEDLTIAKTELAAARAELERSQSEASSSIVRSPSKARVLRVLVHSGEPVGPQGIAELADTGTMQVIAEVYEADIARVHVGQSATVTSELLPKALIGIIISIGSEIETQDSLSSDPGAPTDARIFKVKLKMSDQSVLADRINGKVNVVIHP